MKLEHGTRITRPPTCPSTRLSITRIPMIESDNDPYISSLSRAFRNAAVPVSVDGFVACNLEDSRDRGTIRPPPPPLILRRSLPAFPRRRRRVRLCFYRNSSPVNLYREYRLSETTTDNGLFFGTWNESTLWSVIYTCINIHVYRQARVYTRTHTRVALSRISTPTDHSDS